jgi:uncharacterized caspase-like protein
VKRIFCLLLTMFMAGLAYAQQGETKVALVIGNSTYKAAPLKNPTNDSRDVAAKLRGLGFTVIERSNLTVKQIGGTLREFRSKLTPGSVALVFYAGHGLQIKGENYLPAVDADISSEEDVPTQSLATKQIMDVLGDAKTRLNLVFLDACRDNPYARGFRSASRGLSKESAPSGTLISFATRPGGVASDGDERNGLYTSVLLQAMNSTNLPIEQLLKKVVSGVKLASNSKQEPWMEGSIEGDFCFGQCNAVQTAVSDDRALWESVKDSKDVGELRAYLNRFPNGLFSEVASSRIRSMQAASADQKNALRTEQERKLKERNGQFPPCPSDQWFTEWHMCHAREDFGLGLVIDADFVNGTIYDPSKPNVQRSDYTLIDKIEGKFDVGTLSLGGATLFINFSELIKNGNLRKFKLVINSTKKALYALNERIGFGSVELPLNVQCTSRAFAIDGKVVAFLGTLGYGYPLNPLVLPINTIDANKILQAGLVDLKEMSTETGESMLQIEGVISKVLDSVCKA